jgi:hypothetical protein
LLKKSIPTLHKGREAVLKARLDIAAARAKIALPTVDKADAVGYLRRLEIRGHLSDAGGLSKQARGCLMSESTRSARAIKNFLGVDSSPVAKGADENNALKRATQAAEDAVAGKLPRK